MEASSKPRAVLPSTGATATPFIVKVLRRVEEVRYGYDKYGFLFFIGGVGAVLGSYLGIAGVGATAVTILFFWSAGRVHKHIQPT